MASDSRPEESISHDEFAPGETLAGKYLIGPIVGSGGLSVVVSATHVELDQPVAIKCMRREFLDDPMTLERFVREGRLAIKIKSEHVVRVYDVGRTPHGVPYMVMEFLEGIDLGRKISQGPMSARQVVDYLLQACEALAEAHVLGIVHRDLKPENLFLAKRSAGKPILKVLDFGISKVVGPALRPSAIRTTGGMFGTPVYMSPEQLRSCADVDARSDIWALGVVLYELLSRRFPFEAETLPQLCTKILGDPPASLAGSGVSPALEAIIHRCLAKDPSDRFRNVAELASELAVFASPRSAVHVERIVAVVREAGESVRPSQVTPKPAVVPELLASPTARSFSAEIPRARGSALLLRGGLALLLALGGVGVGVGLTRTKPSEGTRPPEPMAAPTREPPAAAVSFELPRLPEASVPPLGSPASPSASSEAPQTSRIVAPPPPPPLRRNGSANGNANANANAKVTQDAGTGRGASSIVSAAAPSPEPKPSESAPRRERVYRTEF